MRPVAVVFALLNAVILAVDLSTSWVPSRLLHDDPSTDALHTYADALRVAIIALYCLVYVFTYLPLYQSRSAWLIFPLTAVGAATLALLRLAPSDYDTNYGLLILLVTVMFNFTPVPVVWSASACSAFVLAYASLLVSDFHADHWSSAHFAQLPMLALFLAFVSINGVIGYSMERSLKLTVLTEYVLYTDSDALLKQHRLANELLHAMLPSVVLKQLKLGHKLVADHFDEVTVLFCEVHNFHILTDAQRFSPDVCIRALNIIYSRFDEMIETRKHLHKVGCWRGALEFLVKRGCVWSHV